MLGWFLPSEPALFAPERFPVFNVVVPEGRWYGFLVFGVPGFKVGRYHHRGEVGDPDELDRHLNEEDERLLRAFVERYFPAGAGLAASLKACLFENSPDEHFVIDTHPDCGEAIVAAASGHGFVLFVVGEILADLAVAGATRHDIAFLSFDRFEPAGRD